MEKTFSLAWPDIKVTGNLPEGQSLISFQRTET